MKKLLFLLLVAAGLYACKPERSSSVPKEQDYQKAEAFLDRQNDSAFYYFNKVATSSKDSLQVAMAYNGMAQVQSDEGDDFGSQESLLTSLRYLSDKREKDRKCLAADYNELGATGFNLKNYDTALDFYQRALQFSDDADTKIIIRNNIANAYQKKKDYTTALQIYREILQQTPVAGTEYARILSNMAKTQWLKDPAYPAAPELLQALAIRIKAKSLNGQNASYAHLTDYYTLSRPDSALFYAHELYRVAQLIGSADDRIDALQKLIKLSPAERAKAYFVVYERLSDSVHTTRNAARNQFALIRYETEKSKADNLRLQYELVSRNMLLYGTILLFAGFAGAGVFWYRKRKQRLELEAQKRELRLSQKVHDVVANGLYQVMQEVQYQDIPEEQLVDRIERLYQQSRNISHDITEASEDYSAAIADLIQSFATDQTRVLLVGNQQQLWHRINERARSELYAVLRELMVNMRKHSDARNVVLRFSKDEERVHILYTDDGNGMPETRGKGKGLTNTGNRMDGIGGRITFEPNGAKGLRVEISFPIA